MTTIGGPQGRRFCFDPGIVANTTPDDYRVNKQLQMMRFNGERWEMFGPILEDTGPAG